MPTKVNGSGTQQEYDASTGRYGSGEGLLQTAHKLGIQIPNRDLTQGDINKIKDEVAEKKRLQSSDGSGKINLSKQEWAQYYKIIGDEQHGDFVYHSDDNERWVRLDHKLVVDDNEYMTPTVKRVYTYPDNDSMNDVLNILARKGTIK